MKSKEHLNGFYGKENLKRQHKQIRKGIKVKKDMKEIIYQWHNNTDSKECQNILISKFLRPLVFKAIILLYLRHETQLPLINLSIVIFTSGSWVGNALNPWI